MDLPVERGASERGAAMVEFSIVAPLLILFVVGLIHLGLAAVQALSMNGVIRETVQYAANLPMAEGSGGAGHALVQNVGSLLLSQQRTGLDGAATIETRVRLQSGAIPLPENSIEVSMSGRTRTFFRTMGNQTFHYSHTGPYLFQRAPLTSSSTGFVNPLEFLDCDGNPIPGCTNRNDPCVVQSCP